MLDSDLLFILFLKLLEGIISLFCLPLISLFWTSGDISSGFQSQSGQPYSRFREAYIRGGETGRMQV